MGAGEILRRRGLIFALIISIVSSFFIIPAFSMAAFESSSLRILEGYCKADARWERGLLTGWKELDWVPYRVKFATLPRGASNFNFNVYHNNFYQNKYGVDRLRDFRVGDVNGNPVNGSVTASGPFYKTPGKNCDRDIYYSLSVTFNTPSSGLDWYVYWDAHVALGSSGWPGAKLHAYTDISGSSVVPIKVPPIPLGSISGAKWSDLNYNGIWDISESGLSGWTIQLYFFDPVENIWINLDNMGTGAEGSYTFSGLVAGNYRLTEVLKENWEQTYPPPPGSHSITLSEGENRSGVNFGNSLTVHDVEVSVSPSYQSGLNGQTLYYTVMVVNTGNVSDAYDLSVSDNLEWEPSVFPTSLTVPPWENRTATLSVTVPSNAIGCTQDNVLVAAVSQADDTVEDNYICIAHATIVRGVLISPAYQSGLNGVTLNYSVTVTNVGNVPDNYDLIVSDNSGWFPSIFPSSLTLAPGVSDEASLSVIVPPNATGCTEDLITVTAISRSDNTVRGSDNCIAHATIVRGVEVSVSPSYQSGLNGTTLDYTVTFSNTGNVEDIYFLTATDDAGWSPSVSPPSLTVPPWENRTATLSVTVPSNAIGCTQDNVLVAAVSQADDTVEDNYICIAHATIVRGVQVEITPSYKGSFPGTILSYSCRITNTGLVEDTYDVMFWDNENWDIAFTIDTIYLLPYSWVENTLNVTVPENAAPCTEDNITIRVVSRSDNTIENSDSCIANRDKAELTLITKFLVGVDLNLYIENGSKLVLRFYDFSDVFEGENIILDNLAPPIQVIFTENVPHPLGKGIRKATLVILDNGPLQTVANFVVYRDDLWRRLIEIRMEWPYATSEGRSHLWAEISDIRSQWPYALPGHA